MTSNRSSSSYAIGRAFQLSYAIGLDLGQSRDATAIAVVERAETIATGTDWITYARREVQRELRHSVRHLERLPLGTSYPDVVARVGSITRSPALKNRCAVVVDATGVGAPVVDLLRTAHLGGAIVPVVITAGETAAKSGGKWCVPKRHLVTGLRVMLESGELRFARNLPDWQDFLHEMTNFRTMANNNGAHDDLVLALSLACWNLCHRPIGEVAKRLCY